MSEREKENYDPPWEDEVDERVESDYCWTRHVDDEEEREKDPYQEYIDSEQAQFARENNRRMT